MLLTKQRWQPVDVCFNMRVKEDENLSSGSLGSSDSSPYESLAARLMNHLHFAIKVNRQVVIQWLLTVLCNTYSSMSK